MNDVTIFENSEFGTIRTAVVNDEPMFCLADVCKALEIANVGNVKTRLSENGIRTFECECGLTISRDQNAAINIRNEGLRILNSLV